MEVRLGHETRGKYVLKETVKRPLKGKIMVPAYQQWLPTSFTRGSFTEQRRFHSCTKQCLWRQALFSQRRLQYKRAFVVVGSAIKGPPGMGGTSTDSTDSLVQGDRRPGSHKGFVEEMRFVAMRLHTRDQAKEGTLEESALPIQEVSFVLFFLLYFKTIFP